MSKGKENSRCTTKSQPTGEPLFLAKIRKLFCAKKKKRKKTASQSFDYLLMIATTLEKSKRKVPLFVVI